MCPPPSTAERSAFPRGPGPGRGRLWLAMLAFSLAVGPTAFRTISTFSIPGRPDVTLNGMKDFRDAVYFPTVAYLEGVNPYGPEYQQFHPEDSEFPLFTPLTFLLHLPFGLLPYSWAAALYFALQVVLIVALARLLLSACRVDASWTSGFGFAALIAISRPVHVNLYLGQLGLTMMLGCLLALHWAKPKPWLAGLGLALVTIKPNYAVPLAVLMLCRRHFRAVTLGLAVSGVATAVATTVLVMRTGGVALFASQLLSTYGSLTRHPGLESVDVASGRIDAVSILARFSSLPVPGSVKIVVACGCLLLGGIAVLGLSRRQTEQRADGLSATVVCLCLLACVYHNSYDAALLFLPALAVAAARNPVWRVVPDVARWSLASLLALPLLNYLSTRQVAYRLSLEGRLLDSVMSINSVVIFLLFVALAGWALLIGRRLSGLPSVASDAGRFARARVSR